MRKSLLVCAVFLIGATPAWASNPIEKYVPDAQKVGEGRMSYFVWDLYDATLFAPKGEWKNDKPFGLKLSYLRVLRGKGIADRSAEEIRKQGFTDEVKLATWHSQMRNIFTDVDENTSLIGIVTETGETVFYKNNERIGSIRDPEFGVRFFDIWLSPKTSAPDLRAQLLSLR